MMKRIILFNLLFLVKSFFAQNPSQVIGTFQLERISFKNNASTATANMADFSKLINAATFKNSKVNVDEYTEKELQQQASTITLRHFTSRIEFRENGAFYNHSERMKLPTSGEYLLDQKKLYLYWETGEKVQFKIIKCKDDDLVLKDITSKIIFYYSKISRRDFDKMNERLKMEKKFECTKPDKERVEAEKKARAEIQNKQQ